MLTISLALLGVVAFLVILRLMRGGPDVMAWSEHAVHTGNLNLLIEHIESTSDDEGTAWDQAIGKLWQDYHRETGAQLVVEGAQRSDAPVIQYWIKRFLEVEPLIAEHHFTEEFLDEFYRPDVAASCGRCGCG